jgi:hypothetical protein
MAEEIEEWQPASEVLVGVRQSQMIINGIVYCDFCWCIRPDDRSLCPCLAEEVRSCEDCANTKTPCAFCNPRHHENYTAAMAEMAKILADMEEQYPADICRDCYGKKTLCMTCGYSPEDTYDDDDPDYNEHRYEY